MNKDALVAGSSQINLKQSVSPIFDLDLLKSNETKPLFWLNDTAVGLII